MDGKESLVDHPEFITIGPLQTISLGPINIPTYYLIICIASCIGIYWSFLRAEKKGLSQEIALNINAVVLIAGFLGARFFHIIYEAPSYYLENPMEVFYFWQGGFVFLGGAIAGYLAAVIYVKKMMEPLWRWHDTMAPVAALGYAIGRIACFFHGCCYGKICDWPWAISLKQMDLGSQMVTSVQRHPTALYIVIWELALVAFLLYREKHLKTPGQLFFLALFFHSLGRVIMELFREDPRGPTLGVFSISLVLSLIFIGLSIYKLKSYQPETHSA